MGIVSYAPTVSINRGGTDYQLACFWNGDGRLVVARRNLTTGGAWKTWVPAAIGAVSAGGDAHNGAGLGVDPSGFIHISYDHHNDPLNYRVSDQTVEDFDGGFGPLLSMLGTNESNLSYPAFFNDPAGNLYFTFRDGSAGNGDLYFYAYDEVADTWSAAIGTGADGLLIDGKSTSVNPYWCLQPAFDADFGSGGFMHLFWNWRDSTDGTTNHDVLYVRWDGTSFEQSDGSAQTVPITESNAEAAVIVPTSSGQHEMLLQAARTSVGSPLVAFRENDGNGDGQFWAAYRSAGAWATAQITNLSTADADDAARRHTFGIDRATDEGYFWLRVGDEIRAWRSDPDDFSTWSALGAIFSGTILGAPDAFAETPLHDPVRWHSDGVWEGFYQRGITATS